jgi:type IV pilus assembly protein PilY1
LGLLFPHLAQLGRAIYMIDADSGAKLFSISSDADSLNNLQAPLTDAIPADVALLDSDQDGTTDRLYAADTGGNVWRLEMVGDFTDWRMMKLAALGPAQNETIAGVRQFFGQPVIVRSVVRMETGGTEPKDRRSESNQCSYCSSQGKVEAQEITQRLKHR